MNAPFNINASPTITDKTPLIALKSRELTADNFPSSDQAPFVLARVYTGISAVTLTPGDTPYKSAQVISTLLTAPALPGKLQKAAQEAQSQVTFITLSRDRLTLQPVVSRYSCTAQEFEGRFVPLTSVCNEKQSAWSVNIPMGTSPGMATVEFRELLQDMRLSNVQSVRDAYRIIAGTVMDEDLRADIDTRTLEIYRGNAKLTVRDTDGNVWLDNRKINDAGPVPSKWVRRHQELPANKVA